jgi:hypothetical protein
MCNVVRDQWRTGEEGVDGWDGEADPYRRARTRLSSAVRDMMRRRGGQWVLIAVE